SATPAPRDATHDSDEPLMTLATPKARWYGVGVRYTGLKRPLSRRETVSAMHSSPPMRRSGTRPYMVAVVLGTALTALNTAPGVATQSPEVSSKAVNDMSRYCTTCWRNARLHP